MFPANRSGAWRTWDGSMVRRSAQNGKVEGALQFAIANSSIWGIHIARLRKSTPSRGTNFTCSAGVSPSRGWEVGGWAYLSGNLANNRRAPFHGRSVTEGAQSAQTVVQLSRGQPGTIAAPEHPVPAACCSPPQYKCRTVVPYLDSLRIA